LKSVTKVIPLKFSVTYTVISNQKKKNVLLNEYFLEHFQTGLRKKQTEEKSNNEISEVSINQSHYLHEGPREQSPAMLRSRI